MGIDISFYISLFIGCLIGEIFIHFVSPYLDKKKSFTAFDARQIANDYSTKIKGIEKSIKDAAEDNKTCLPYIYIIDEPVINHFRLKGFTVEKSEDSAGDYYDIKWEKKNNEERKRYWRIFNRGNNKS